MGIVWICNIIALLRGGDAWLAITYLLIMLIPLGSLVTIKLTGANRFTLDRIIDCRKLLFAFQGVALAFWAFDVITTFYAINMTGLATELNPLGWPMGIFGAAAFYLPALAGSYVLLFRLKGKAPLYAAIPFTLLTLAMAFMNLFAGAQNFQVFVDTAALASSARFNLVASFAAFDLAIPLTLRYIATHPKQQLALKAA
jgi:hypothetical protein